MSCARGRTIHTLSVAALVAFATPALAQLELRVMAPAAPGGGWDQTAPSMQQALVASGAE
jgi:putative tricarboxylic transport membrane protein